MTDRIKTAYKPGCGDRGYSKMFAVREGDRIVKYDEVRKDDPICWVYRDCQKIETFLNKRRIDTTYVTPTLSNELEFLRKNIRCFSGFAHLYGYSPKNVFPRDYVDRLEESIKHWNKVLDDAPDFIQEVNSMAVLHLNELCDLVRELETNYTAWTNHPFVIRNLYNFFADKPEEVVQLGQDIIYMGTVLNRLSGYLWTAARFETYSLGLKEHYWEAKVVMPTETAS